ncbi:MAG: DcaP family trimeric outer membrane transporter [Bacteroidota bacterium]
MIRQLVVALLSIVAVNAMAQTPDNEVEMYGHFMTDIGYDLDQSNPNWFDVVRATQLPSYPNQYGTDGNIFFSVRQSRLGFRSYQTTKRGPIKGRFEMDFFGVGANVGETAFHLRLAYLEWGSLVAGLTWSPFVDPDATPATLEFWGPIGIALYRNIQVGYTAVKTENNTLQVAIERPGVSADEGVYTSRIALTQVKPEFNYPDFSYAFRHTFSNGYFRLSGIYRKISWRDLQDDQYDLNGSANAWGLNLSSVVALTPKNRLMGQIFYGKGIQSCINDGTYDIGVRTIGDSLSKRPIEGYALPGGGFFAALEHRWNSKLSSTLAYSTLFIDNAQSTLATSFQQGNYALTNLRYKPTSSLMVGVEFQWAQRRNEAAVNGFQTAEQRRIQLSFKYSFNHKLKTD